MKLLAIDTAGQWASVALHWEGVTAYRQMPGYSRHSDHLLPTIVTLFAEMAIEQWQKELQAVAFAAGPGAFTGIRLACSLAQGLAMALGCPVIPLDSLELVGRSAFLASAPPVVVALADARMGQWYARPFAVVNNHWRPLAAPTLIEAGQWEALLALLTAAGVNQTPFGVATWQIPLTDLPTAVTTRAIEALNPAVLLSTACTAYCTGQFVPAEAAEPIYVRQQVALTAAEQQQRRRHPLRASS